jgi:hypothetical protein
METVMEDPKENRDQLSSLLTEISDEMLERTGGDRYRSGQPLLSDPSFTPPPQAEEPPVVEPTSTEAQPSAETPDSKPTSEPEKLILGKWKSEDEAIRGYHEAVHMGNAAKAERDALAVQVAALRTQLGGEVKPPVDPDDEIEAFGVPKDPLNRMIERRARQVVNDMFAPALQQIQADQEIVQKYPEYQTRSKELFNFVDANPDIKASVEAAEKAGQFGLAREFAWLRFTAANATKIETETKLASETRTQEIKATRRDAGVNTAQRAEARAKPPEQGLTEKDFERLKELAKAGHPTPLLRASMFLAISFTALLIS